MSSAAMGTEFEERMPTAASNVGQQREPAGLNEQQLKHLVYNIGMEWQALGTYLRFSNSEITRIRHENPHNTDDAIMHMLKTWNARQRNNTTNLFDVLADALRHASRVDLAENVLQWKGERTRAGGSQGGSVHGAAPGRTVRAGQGEPHMQQDGGSRATGQRQVGLDGFQQVYGAGARSKAPSTLSKPPEVRINVKTLPQYKSLVEMFPNKAGTIETLLKESPNIDENALLDKLLS